MTARELKLDYFKFYDVENRSVQGTVGLQGQFRRNQMLLGFWYWTSLRTA